MIKLIIFDWDDVITLGAKEGYFKCYHETLERLDFHLSKEEEEKRILAKWGKDHKEELKSLLQEKPELLDKARKIYKEVFSSGIFINSLRFLPGTNEVLKRLAKKYTLAVATGQFSSVIADEIMPKFDIPNVFTQIVSSYEINNPNLQKPHPFALEKIMKDQKIKLKETVFVGDAKGDMEMAFNAHVTPITVLSGHLNQKQAEKLGVKYIIKDVRDLEKILGKI